MSALLTIVTSILERGDLVEWDDYGAGMWQCRDCYAESKTRYQDGPPVPFPHHADCRWVLALEAGRSFLPELVVRLKLL